MLSWVVVFRDRDTGTLLPMKVKANSAINAERAALAQLADKLAAMVDEGAWATHSITRCSP